VQDEGRQKNAHDDVDSETEPAGANVFEDFKLAHGQKIQRTA
jgi:hypothetical protein